MKRSSKVNNEGRRTTKGGRVLAGASRAERPQYFMGIMLGLEAMEVGGAMSSVNRTTHS